MSTKNRKQISEVLSKLLLERGLSAEKFSEEIGEDSRSVRNWASGEFAPRAEKLKKIADYFRIPVGTFLGESISNVSIAPKIRGLRRVPVVASMRAGFLSEIAANYDDIARQIDETIETDCQDENSFALIVEGDSMEPRFQAGDRIIIAPNWEPRPGDPVVARFLDDGKTIFKIYRPLPPKGEKVRFESLNPAHEPMVFDRSEFRFIYPAVDLKAKLRR